MLALAPLQRQAELAAAPVSAGKLRRTFDAAFLNTVANHPDVHPWIGAVGEVDLSAAILNPANVALVNNGGGFFLMCHEPGIYEVHSQFLPEARGGSITAMRDGFDYLFTRTDCHTVLTQVPDINRAAAALAKHARFRPMFRRADTMRGPTAYMGLTVEQWVQDNPDLEADGEWFHDSLSAAKKLSGSDLPEHAHDPAHERAVGAAVRMIRAGNARKGIGLYNQWARFAGYLPVSLISETPVIVDVGDAVVELNGSEMEVLICR
jgi:hypothetical protein